MEIPARSVVAGLPARIRRAVEDKDIVLIKGYRDIYVRNTAMYLKEGLS
jgi:carbonic anhydrase/acetyltransferase-like protein (isoleucine patch superfamily)